MRERARESRARDVLVTFHAASEGSTKALVGRSAGTSSAASAPAASASASASTVAVASAGYLGASTAATARRSGNCRCSACPQMTVRDT